MSESKETIIKEIKTYIEEHGGNYSDWYIGIASDPEKRLFDDHNVDRENGVWIYRKAENSNIARAIEEYFVETLGADGGSGGGDYTTKFVYAYKKISYTNE